MESICGSTVHLLNITRRASVPASVQREKNNSVEDGALESCISGPILTESRYMNSWPSMCMYLNCIHPLATTHSVHKFNVMTARMGRRPANLYKRHHLDV